MLSCERLSDDYGVKSGGVKEKEVEKCVFC